jgi:hypothetical protein
MRMLCVSQKLDLTRTVISINSNAAWFKFMGGNPGGRGAGARPNGPDQVLKAIQIFLQPVFPRFSDFSHVLQKDSNLHKIAA